MNPKLNLFILLALAFTYVSSAENPPYGAPTVPPPVNPQNSLYAPLTKPIVGSCNLRTSEEVTLMIPCRGNIKFVLMNESKEKMIAETGVEEGTFKFVVKERGPFYLRVDSPKFMLEKGDGIFFKKGERLSVVLVPRKP